MLIKCFLNFNFTTLIERIVMVVTVTLLVYEIRSFVFEFNRHRHMCVEGGSFPLGVLKQKK